MGGFLVLWSIQELHPFISAISILILPVRLLINHSYCAHTQRNLYKQDTLLHKLHKDTFNYLFSYSFAIFLEDAFFYFFFFLIYLSKKNTKLNIFEVFLRKYILHSKVKCILVEFVKKSVLMTQFNAVSVRSGHIGHVFQWNPKFLMLGQMPIWNSCQANR
jgi:hypothetical protein